MGSYRLKKVTHHLFTGMALVTIIVTTFWTGSISSSRAASAPVSGPGTTTGNAPAVDPGSSAPQPTSINSATRPVPLNAVVLGTPDTTAALEQQIRHAGGYVYVQQGNALFVGLNGLSYADLAPVGARAVYQGSVPAQELDALPSADRASIAAWNEITSRARQAQPTISGSDVSTRVFIPTDQTRANSTARVDAPAASDQTSAYMIGDVAVRVLFIESNTSAENWTEVEIAKVKGEILQALDWWSVAATTPETLGEVPRPPANLSWQVSYVSPFEGSLTDRPKIQVGVEPITLSLGTAVTDSTGWMPQVAAAFTGYPADGTALRRLADNARWDSTRTTQTSDWAFTLFVVDSSTDADGLFADGKAGGAALNGPYAIVSSKGGDLGLDNLEILIAKMVGHVFGAGSESYNPATAEGCRTSELYGYFRIQHSNCEQSANVSPSLMRAGSNMIDAYQNNELSNPAREEVGWYDGDGNGTYDVLDTLRDTFNASYFPSPAPACPVLHIANIDILNTAPQPEDIGGVGPGWTDHIWDSSLGQYVNDYPVFGPININWPGYVWGRVNGGAWVAGGPADGVAWARNTPGYKYTLMLPGMSGMLNRVEIALMNRWDQTSYLSSPVNVSTAPATSSALVYESNDNEVVNLFAANGVKNTLNPQWSTSVLNPGYSSQSTMLSSTVKSEACFVFSGTEVTLYHSNETTGTANVYVDGALHSIITYDPAALPTQKAKHLISNLSNGVHTVKIEVASGTVDFDAFQLTHTAGDATQIINAGPGGDIADSAMGFYEAPDAPKIQYIGQWSTIDPLPAPGRPGLPAIGTPNAGKRSSRAYDRIYAFFQNADTIGIYRSVYPGGGSADVYIDGELRGTMYNDAVVTRVLPFYVSGLDYGAIHTLEVRINPNTPHFDLDALRFLYMATDLGNLCVDAAGAAPLDVPFGSACAVKEPRYGVWTPKTTWIESKEGGALLTMFFQGSAVGVNVGTSTSDGLLEMYVDGRLVRTADTKTASSKDHPLIAHGFDPTRPHVLQIRQINAIPAKPKVIQVYGYTVYYVASVTLGSYEEYQYDPVSGKPTQSDFIYEQAWKFLPKAITAAAKPSAGRFIESAHEQARSYLYFTGADTLTIYGVAGAAYGGADIYVNGVFKGTFIEKKPATTYNVPFTLTGFDKAAFNMLEIRVNVTAKLPKKIALDRVVLYNNPRLGPGTYQNNGTVDVGGSQAPALQFSGQWTEVASTSADGTFTMSNAIGDEVSFDVTGATSVVVYRRLYTKYGFMEVYVDGKLYSAFDNYTSTPLTGVFKQPFVISGLDAGFDHHIRLVAQRSGKKLDKFKPFDLDYIVVRTGDQAAINYLENDYYDSDDFSNGGAALTGHAINYLGASWKTASQVYTATTKGDKAQILFKGNVFRVYVNKSTTGSKALVYIDGKLYGTIDSRASTIVNDVPYTYVNLPVQIHTVEIVAQGRFNIRAYEVFTRNAYPAGTYNTVPLDPGVLLSGQWTLSGNMLQTKEQFASIFLYVKDVDTVSIDHWVNTATGDIQVYVNGVLHSTIDATYIKSRTGLTEAEYLVSGLAPAMAGGGWIEIRNPKAKAISIKFLRAENIDPPLTDLTPSNEAETGTTVRKAGYWVTKTDVRASNSSYIETKNYFAHFYIPTQNLSYVTIYRPLMSGYGDANVYIDGVFWGTMPNTSSTVRHNIPFSVGPIPDPFSAHVVELRAAAKKNFGVDRIVGLGVQSIGPGYYEDSHAVFIGGDYDGKSYTNAYVGTWKVVNDALASGGTVHETTTRGNQVVAVFEGNELILYRRMTTRGAAMKLYVDGVIYPINNKALINTNRVAHTILLPNGGPHSFELISDSGQADFDAIEVKNVVPVGEGAYQQDSLYVVLNGTWTTVSSPINSGKSYVSTNGKYNSMFFLFMGNQATVYMNRGKNWGILSVYVDGVYKGAVSQYLYDKVAHPIDEAFFTYDISGLSDSMHVVELRFEGKKDRLGQLIVNFDAITVNGFPAPLPDERTKPEEPGGVVTEPQMGCYEDYDTTHWKFISNSVDWAQYGSSLASGGSYNRGTGIMSSDEVYASFTFQGTGFALMYHQYRTGGYAQVIIDGTPQVDVINMYDPAESEDGVYHVVYSVTGLSDAVHEVRFKWTNTKPLLSKGTNIYIDRIDVPYFNPPVAGCTP